MKISIFGSSGFVGKNLVKYLFENIKSSDLTIIGSYYKNKVINFKNSNFKLVKCNLGGKKIKNIFFEKTDLLIFLAGISKPKFLNLDEYLRINSIGITKVLNLALKNKVKKVIIVSSVAAIGPNLTNKMFNENDNENPQENYGKSKLIMEKIANNFSKKGLNLNILRPTTIYGIHDNEFTKFFKLNKIKFFPIRCDKKCIEYLSIDDFCKAIILVSKRGKRGETYNVAPNKKYSLNQILNKVENVTGQKWMKLYLPRKLMKFFFERTVNRLTDYYFNTNSNKIRKLGFKDNSYLLDDIKKLYNQFKKNENKI